MFEDRTRVGRTAGDQQRRFGHAVTRQHARPAEPERCEFFGERVEGFRSDRFGTVKRDRPRRQVDALHLRGIDLVDAQLVGEVRSPGHRDAVLSDALQPSRGALQERHRAGQHVLAPDEHRHHHAADQSHVVVGRQPRTTDRAGLDVEPLEDQLAVGDQIALGQHHAFGRSGRTGRVLQDRQRLRRDLRSPQPVAGPVGRIVGGDQPDADQIVVLAVALQLLDDAAGRQCPTRVGVDDDRPDPRGLSVATRRERRDRDRPDRQTGEEPDDEIQSRGVQQQHPVAGPDPAAVLQVTGQPPHLVVQFGVGQRDFVGLEIAEDVRRLVGLEFRPVFEDGHEIVRRRGMIAEIPSITGGGRVGGRRVPGGRH